MKFIETHNNLFGEKGAKIEYTVPEDANLDEVLESFVDFLRGCGYTIPYESYLSVVSDYDEEFPTKETTEKREPYWDYMSRRFKEEGLDVPDRDDRVEHWGQDVDFD